MAVTKLMEEAADRKEQAERRLTEMREATFTPGNLKAWLTALTDYALALGEVQEYSQQSIHEKLQELAQLVRHPQGVAPKRQAG
jgi:hypothetical protein